MYYFVLNKTVGITQDEQNIRTRSDDNQYVVVVDDFVVFVKMVRRTTARGFIVRQNDEQENKKKDIQNSNKTIETITQTKSNQNDYSNWKKTAVWDQKKKNKNESKKKFFA